jgi:hypothetical protein
MNVFDTLHALIDRSAIHDAKDAELLHDAVTAQEQGYKSAEEYRKAQAAKQPSASPDEEDAILARAAEIKAQRDAQAQAAADQQAAIAARESAAQVSVSRLAPPVAAGTPASPTADPDAPPPF